MARVPSPVTELDGRIHGFASYPAVAFAYLEVPRAMILSRRVEQSGDCRTTANRPFRRSTLTLFE